MNNYKKLNLKKQLFSLKYCYEDQLLQTRALISRVHNLENIFKITKQFIKEKTINNIDFNFKNEKRYLLIKSQKKNLSKNLDKQKKTLLNSILNKKYQELQKEKELLIQTLEEKSSILDSIKNELNIFKIYRHGSQVSTIYLNNIFDSLLTNNKINNINNDIDNNIKNKFSNIISKEKLKLKKKCEETCNDLNNLYNYLNINYQSNIKAKGFNSYIINNKNKKTYILNVEPIIRDDNNISSDDSDSENINEIKINDSNSINDHIFDQNKENISYLNKSHLTSSKKEKDNNFQFLRNSSLAYENTEQNYGSSFIKNLFRHNYKGKINNNLKNPEKDKFRVLTENNNGRSGDLNRKLLKIKENYYKCLDQRYELKSSLKENISQIYYIKEKIKKFKRDKNKKENNIS